MLIVHFQSIFKDTKYITFLKLEEFKRKFEIEKRYVPKPIKDDILFEQEYKCNHCKMLLPPSKEDDHIIPLWKGGTNDRENQQYLCRNCHGEKTRKDETEFWEMCTLLHQKIY
jgi:5-methylcytosine-specific restriction endonuclease McrA